MSKVVRFLAAGLVVLLLLLRLPQFFDHAATNGAAVATMLQCNRGEMHLPVAPKVSLTPDPPQLNSSGEPISSEAGAERDHQAQDAWLQASVALCRGNLQAARPFLAQSLRASDLRLAIIRASAPNDVELARFAAQQYPAVADSHEWLGDALVAAGQTAAALPEYQLGLAYRPQDADAWYALGKLAEDAGQMGVAEDAYDSACTYVDSGRHGCFAAGRVYEKAGKYDLAMQRYQDAANQAVGASEAGAAQRGMATVLLDQNRIDEAISILRDLAKNGDQIAKKKLLELTPTAAPTK